MTWTNLIGGLGIFVLGMLLLSDGLKSAASQKLHDLLKRFTQTRFRSILAGFVTTASLQSSSATILITISLVNAGLMSFNQSIGIVFGANLGTTTTAWIVSTVGFKINLSLMALPLITLGTFLKILTKGVWSYLGLACAGFGLLFLGIDLLQSGMSGLADQVNLSQYAGAGIGGRVLLLFIGIIMTVIMQSSSAATAATITALSAQAIELDQAAILVIGQNIGTTVKSFLGSIGATTAAKRTAAVHIVFNVVTGLAAFILLPVFLTITALLSDFFFGAEGGKLIALSTFHTVFNLSGVLICLPLASKMAYWIERWVPEEKSHLVRRLNQDHLTGSAVDLEAARLTLMDIAQELIRAEKHSLDSKDFNLPNEKNFKASKIALGELYDYFSSISISPDNEKAQDLSGEMIHALDHLNKFSLVLEENPHLGLLTDYNEVETLLKKYKDLLDLTQQWFKSASREPLSEKWTLLLAEIKSFKTQMRAELIREATAQPQKLKDFAPKLDGLRRFEGLVKSLSRLSYYLEQMDQV